MILHKIKSWEKGMFITAFITSIFLTFGFLVLITLYYIVDGWIGIRGGLFLIIIGYVSIILNTFFITVGSIVINKKYEVSKKLYIVLIISLLLTSIPPTNAVPWNIPNLVTGILLIVNLSREKKLSKVNDVAEH